MSALSSALSRAVLLFVAPQGQVVWCERQLLSAPHVVFKPKQEMLQDPTVASTRTRLTYGSARPSHRHVSPW